MEPNQLNQLLKDSKGYECVSCGSKFFKNVFLMRSVSKFLTQTPQDMVIPIPVWRCDDCGTPMEKMDPTIPDESVNPKILTGGAES